MKFKTAKLEFDSGCVCCNKPCNFNGVRVDAESNKAAKRDRDHMLISPNSANKYGCNSSK
jgi:hypothetical protein